MRAAVPASVPLAVRGAVAEEEEHVSLLQVTASHGRRDLRDPTAVEPSDCLWGPLTVVSLAAKKNNGHNLLC